MLKIGDFSQLGQVSVRTLHHYDERGLLKPAETDYWTGYRFYAVEQLPRLNRILALKDLGFSLDQISGLIHDDEVPAERLRGMLSQKQAELERQLADGRSRLARVEARLKRIEREDQPSPYEVVMKRSAPKTVVAARAVVPTLADVARYRCDLYERVYDYLERHGARLSGPELALYHNETYVERDMDMEAALPVEPHRLPDGEGVVVRQLPAVPRMATATFEGRDLWDLPGAVAALFQWAGEHGYASAGPLREVHHFGRELDHEDHASLVMEVQLPVERLQERTDAGDEGEHGT